MTDLVVLSSPLGYGALILIAALHIVAILPPVSRKKTLLYLTATFDMLLHLALIAFCLVRGATGEEILLLLMASGTVGITAISILERLAKGRTDEEGEV